jgi:hypothetical protein
MVKTTYMEPTNNNYNETTGTVKKPVQQAGDNVSTEVLEKLTELEERLKTLEAKLSTPLIHEED